MTGALHERDIELGGHDVLATSAGSGCGPAEMEPLTELAAEGPERDEPAPRSPRLRRRPRCRARDRARRWRERWPCGPGRTRDRRRSWCRSSTRRPASAATSASDEYPVPKSSSATRTPSAFRRRGCSGGADIGEDAPLGDLDDETRRVEACRRERVLDVFDETGQRESFRRDVHADGRRAAGAFPTGGLRASLGHAPSRRSPRRHRCVARCRGNRAARAGPGSGAANGRVLRSPRSSTSSSSTIGWKSSRSSLSAIARDRSLCSSIWRAARRRNTGSKIASCAGPSDFACASATSASANNASTSAPPAAVATPRHVLNTIASPFATRGASMRSADPGDQRRDVGDRSIAAETSTANWPPDSPTTPAAPIARCQSIADLDQDPIADPRSRAR